MYNRAFLRTYCAHLELDAEDFVRRMEQEATTAGEKGVKSKPRAPEPPSQPIRIPPLLIWSLMLLASVGGLYFSRKWIAAVFSPYFARPPATRLGAPPSQPPVAAKPAEPEARPVEEPGTGAGVVPQTAAQTAVPVPADVQPAVPQGAIHLQFHAVQECWISVVSDGKTIESKTLTPGEDKAYDANDRFEIRLGNAGGVNLLINGKPAKPLGKEGEVLQVVIDPKSIPDLLQKVTG